ncbi:MAG: MBL fold metallo-hydrolase, partial [Rhodococcus sp. (in: high G+C Gram-positive bacteria)]
MPVAEVDNNPLFGGTEITVVAPGIFTMGLQGNSLAVETDEGLLVVDSGPSPSVVPQALAQLREHTDQTVRWIVYSHGHLGYNYGVPGFLAEAE